VAGRLARIGVPIARHVFLEERLSANQLKLFIGLQYLVSSLPDITNGENPNITTLPECVNDECPPLWKSIKINNWNKTLKSIGFETDHAQRLKQDLLTKLTKVEVPPYPIMIEGQRHTVETRGSSIVRVKRVIQDDSGKIREFVVMVGGYEPVLKNWWQAISPKFLFFEGTISVPAWRFIILLGGAIRREYCRIKKYLEKYEGLNHWAFTMNMPRLERKMGIADQNNERKAEVWKEIYALLGIDGVTLADMTDFPPKRVISYKLGRFFNELDMVWWKARGFDKSHPPPRDILKNHRIKQQLLKAKRGDDTVGFLLNKEMLLEWLPLLP
jgi:hypothetical protein